jgi:threonine dehydrogenase-like Zn-dependent dehydrogenase
LNATSYLGYMLTAPRVLRSERFDLPTLAPGWARVRIIYCGICGSDLSVFEGRRQVSYPLSLGHEFVAEVIATGERVEGLVLGQTVTSDLNFRCGACDHCKAGRSHLCRRGREDFFFSNRGFAELADIRADYLTKIEGPPEKHLALAEPLSCVSHAKQWVDPSPGERVLVVGAGGLGSCLAFSLFCQAIEFDIVDLLPGRLESIEPVIDPIGRAVTEAAGEYDAVFDMSGTELGLRTACERVRSGGRLCTMSHLDGYSSADFLLSALTRRDIAFKVSYINGNRETMKASARQLGQLWNSRWDPLLEVVPSEELQAAFDRRRASPFCQTLVKIGSAVADGRQASG